ncbi:reverse transcriptase-like protein [Candidatus Peregrinibacteria bacterium]|nr:reverse transcriptase-like protein [Candidatus Peregrinibacteria bacterium]
MGNTIVYTDGSCLGNPGPGGWAAIIRHEGKEYILKGNQKDTTNNRMELTAIIEAVIWLAEHVHDQKVDLYSDSSLLINSINEDWKRKANRDLWEAFDRAIKRLNGVHISWHWVKGHADDSLNNRVDKLAVRESKKVPHSAPITPSHPKDGFYCGHCKKNVSGVLSWMPDSQMIRVDCEQCGNYIMFAEKTKEHIAKAKKRILISKKQLEKVLNIKENRGETVTDRDQKEIKKWTRKKAQDFIDSEQTLF